MYPGTHAAANPEKPALIMGRSGEVVSYGELEERSCQLAQLLWAAGIRPGGHLAIFMENHPRYAEAYWAAFRSGLYVTTVNRHLSAEEAAYIVDDSGAEALVTACPWCERNFRDAVKAMNAKIKVLDITDLVKRAI